MSQDALIIMGPAVGSEDRVKCRNLERKMFLK